MQRTSENRAFPNSNTPLFDSGPRLELNEPLCEHKSKSTIFRFLDWIQCTVFGFFLDFMLNSPGNPNLSFKTIFYPFPGQQATLCIRKSLGSYNNCVLLQIGLVKQKEYAPKKKFPYKSCNFTRVIPCKISVWRQIFFNTSTFDHTHRGPRIQVGGPWPKIDKNSYNRLLVVLARHFL